MTLAFASAPAAASSPAAVAAEAPLVPDGPEGRQWLLDELAKPEYTAAKPTAIEEATQAFFDWVGGLFSGAGDVSSIALAIIAGAIIAAVVAAVLVYGLPRLRSRRALAGAVFGAEDARTAGELRRAAEAAAARDDWDAAIEDAFRALALALVERTVVVVSPGTTSHVFARRAARVFPGRRSALEAAAETFDGVRYLGRAGDEAGYLRIAALDRELSAHDLSAGGVSADTRSGVV